MLQLNRKVFRNLYKNVQRSQIGSVQCLCPSTILCTKRSSHRGVEKETELLNRRLTKVFQKTKSKDILKFLKRSEHFLRQGAYVWSSNRKPYQDFEPHHNQDGDNEKPELPGDDPEKSSSAQMIRFALFTGVMAFLLLSTIQDNVPETSWPIFLRLMLQTGEVEKLTVNSQRDKVYVFLARGAIINGKEIFGHGPHYSFSVGNAVNFEDRIRAAQEEMGIPPDEFIPVKFKPPDNQIMSTLISVGISIGLFALIGYYMFGRRSGSGGSLGGNPFNSHTRAKATVILPGTKSNIGFKDVAGMGEAKEEVREFVDYLQYPTRFKELGAKIPKGALLCGPPGTGKTLLAKAVASEAAVPFLSMAGSDFVEMFAGVGSARVRDLFTQARKRAPCIVYIDEIDAIGRSRRSSMNSGGNSEQENTLNQLLVEMDGMNTVDGVVMLASTNRPDILDQALMRPGRFDRMITIDLPTLLERKSIFEIYLSKLKLGESIRKYSKRLAELTPSKSGADIANICNEAALHAARLNENIVDDKNFEYAIERVIVGIQKKTNPLSPEERRTVAYHEAGHALVSWLLKYTEPVLKISIIPRTNTPLGYTQKFPLDVKLHTNEQLFDMMCATLGGRVAEKLIFESLTTGAEDDLKKVTDMAYKQIVTFGMNERVGPISFTLRKQSEQLSRKPYSDKMARMIDEEARSMITHAHVVTERLLKENKEKLEKLAEELLNKEVVNHDDLVNLIGPCPHGDKRQTFYKYAFQPRE